MKIPENMSEKGEGEEAGGSGGEMLVDQGAQLEGERILQAVKDTLALLSAREDAGGGEEGEVLGNIGLGRADGRDNRVDGARPAADGLQDAQAHRLAQEAEAQGDLLQLAFRQEMIRFGG